MFPDDEAKLAPSSDDLRASIAEAGRACEAVEQVAQDIDSDRVSLDGVIVTEFDEEDTIVRSVRQTLDRVRAS